MKLGVGPVSSLLVITIFVMIGDPIPHDPTSAWPLVLRSALQ